LSIAAIDGANAQGVNIRGSILDQKDQPIPFTTVMLNNLKDSTLVKAEISDDNGGFVINDIKAGDYFISSSYIGMLDYQSEKIIVTNIDITLASIIMRENSLKLDEIQVTAQRALIEIKPDRKVFNVQGMINAVGGNGLNILRKAPGVLVDNNNNISVLGRAGVLLYVDGKRIPLSGNDLVSYLENINSEQIDKIDIITSPGSKYEAQGNAGIIDIRLKKDSSIGANGSISATYGHGKEGTGNINASGNYKNKKINAYGNITYNDGTRWNNMSFQSFQNGLFLDESNLSLSKFNGISTRIGLDISLSDQSTIGVLVSNQKNNTNVSTTNRNFISKNIIPYTIDSLLKADNTAVNIRAQNTYNVNYALKKKNSTLNVDLDYGSFINTSDNFQPNRYFAADGVTPYSQNLTQYQSPNDIYITTAKIDYEINTAGGKLELGTKYSDVRTFNTFLFSDLNSGSPVINDKRSNKFDYKEGVTAVYTNYKKKISSSIDVSAGLRVEHTKASGDLTAFLPELEEDPVNFDYLSYFPSAGITYSSNPEHVYSLNYGRRINRPNYNVLNPFREQLSELSFSRGNKFLQPEIVNNIETGYTYKYMYTLTAAYSLTTNQITRLIGPDDIDPRAGFISWDNLATQKLYSLSLSAPFEIKKWWNSYFNITAAYTNNQADYGTNGTVDVQAGSYNIFQQQTFELGKKYKGEFSGWYSGPGVWGGVFLYDPSYTLDFGVQRKYFNDKVNIRISVTDVTFQTGWSGASRFNGLESFGRGNWDSRRGTLSLSYDFGNNKVKSRKRNTSLENEKNRVGS